MEEIKGRVKDIVHQIEGELWQKFTISYEDGEISVVGKGPAVQKGERVFLWGQFETHKIYGYQFHFQQLSPLLDLKQKDLIRAMSSGAFYSVGEAKAKVIYMRYREKSLDVLSFSAGTLVKEGLLKLAAIERMKGVDFLDQPFFCEVLLFCSSFGISLNKAQKVFKVFKNQSISTLKENPYRASKIKGIGFKICDQMALRLGFAKNNPIRVESYILQTLRDEAQAGHCYLPKRTLFSKVSQEINIGPLLCESVYAILLERGSIWEREMGDESLVYLQSIYLKESYLAQRISQMTKFQLEERELIDRDQIVDQIISQSKMRYEREQILAAKRSISRSISTLSGGPGTGKTTTLKLILESLNQLGLSYKLCSPTGKASRVMSRVSNQEAQTIHGLLGVLKSGFKHSDSNPLNVDFVIVDETSMSDLHISFALFRGISQKTSVILLGDSGQLPSVGPGQILKDLIESQSVEGSKLLVDHRSGKGSDLGRVYREISDGNIPLLPSWQQRARFPDKSVFLDYQNSKEEILESLVQNTYKVLQKYALDQVQVFSPMKKGILGVDNINSKLRQRVNPLGRILGFCSSPSGHREFWQGDKVIFTKSFKREDIKNGEEALVVKASSEGVRLRLKSSESQEEDREIELQPSQLSYISLAYCITTHKSQGSEYSVVIFPLATAHFPLIDRSLLVTSLTRAKKGCLFVGSMKALSLYVKKHDFTQRRTTLGYLLSREN